MREVRSARKPLASGVSATMPITSDVSQRRQFVMNVFLDASKKEKAPAATAAPTAEPAIAARNTPMTRVRLSRRHSLLT